MYLSIAYLLITMCFTNLIQILPTETDLSSPWSTFINTPRHVTTGNTSRHTYTSKQLWAIYGQVKPTTYQNCHLDQPEELGISDLIKNQQQSSQQVSAKKM